MTKKVWVMCGIPASGKSSYIFSHYNPSCDRWISRDDIRFTLLRKKPTDNYFAYETEVWNIFVKNIRNAISEKNVENIYIDATHINERSRNKILNQLDLSKVELNAISFNIPLDVCLTRNEGRQGLAYVPEDVIRNMWLNFNPPAEGEKYHYKKIITIE